MDHRQWSRLMAGYSDDLGTGAPNSLENRRFTELVSNMTGSMDHEVTPLQERLKAAPTVGCPSRSAHFLMALLTGVLGGGQPDVLCSAAEHASLLSGVIPMYLLRSSVRQQAQ
jgi:hypothetical protein